MRKRLWTKGLVFGIILLFIGANATSNVIGDNEKYDNTSHQLNIEKSLSYQISSGDPPAEEWRKSFGGSNYDEGNSVEQTDDGGFIITGCTYSFGGGGSNVWLIKTYSDGTMMWNTTFGIGNSHGQSVKQTLDGGYVIAGNVGDAVLLIKTNPSGIPEWKKNYTAGFESDCRSVDQTYDGKYIVAGTGMGITPSDHYYAFLMKIDTNGSQIWQRQFGHFWSNSYGYYAQETSDHGYIITGVTFEYGVGDGDLWLIKTNSDGIEQWNKTFNGPQAGDNSDVGFSVQQTTDGGFIIVGVNAFISDEIENADLWLLKTGSTGNHEWNMTYNRNIMDIGLSVDQTIEGGYVMTGYTSSSGLEDADLWIIRTNADGVEQWSTTLGGTGADFGYSVQQTTNRGFIIAGSTDSYGAGLSDAWLIKLGAEDNQPPFPPSIDGPTSGDYREAHQWNFTATDPDNDDIQYFVDWGDGTNTSWSLAYNSGETMPQSHKYSAKGTYTIKAKVKDIYGLESDWEKLSVKMPCSYNIPFQPIWERLFERFPNAFPILRHLLGY